MGVRSLISASWSRFRRDRRGHIAMIVALLAPPLALGVTVGVELSSLAAEERLMQAAADAAALASAKEQTVAQSSTRDLQSAAERFALNSLGDYPQRATVSFTAERLSGGGIRVVGQAYRPSFFGDLIPRGGFRINVDSEAEAVGEAPICFIGTRADGNAVVMEDSSRLQADGCLVHSNRDIKLASMSEIHAGLIQAVGIADGAGFFPSPNAGALSIPDPFAALPLNPPSTCKPTGVIKIDAGSAPLPAGVHCSNVMVQKGARLVLGPGDHHFMGELKVQDDTVVTGDDVVLVFHGKSAKGEFVDRASVDLKGRRSGPLAGFVLITSRDSNEDFLMTSANVDTLEGTVYIPNASLKVRSGSNIVEESKWTVVVARDVSIAGATRMVIKRDYTLSPVPVPRGVGPTGQSVVRLTQ